MRQTSLLKTADIQKKWYVVDAKDLVLGRMSTQVAMILRGKNKPSFTPYLDCGDNVIIINADKIVMTGNKWKTKTYYHHSLYPGGLKSASARDVMAKNPVFMVERAVRLMLPKGVLGRNQYRNLFVYAGDQHPHSAQQPEVLDLSKIGGRK